MEEWREITEKGFTFLVSNLGGVKAPPRKNTYCRTRNGKVQHIERIRKEQTYTPQSHHTGYREIGLRHNGVRIRILLHRLIALAFVEGYEEGLCVNHINGIKTDNRAENLEWVSLARNTQHAWENGLVDVSGENQPMHKLTSRQVVYIRRLLNQGVSAHAISVIAGLSDVTIHNIKIGKSWKR